MIRRTTNPSFVSIVKFVPEQEPALDRFISRKDLLKLTGIPQSTLYEMMKEGTFPRGVKITARRVGWRESEIVAWQKSRKPGRYV